MFNSVLKAYKVKLKLSWRSKSRPLPKVCPETPRFTYVSELNSQFSTVHWQCSVHTGCVFCGTYHFNVELVTFVALCLFLELSTCGNYKHPLFNGLLQHMYFCDRSSLLLRRLQHFVSDWRNTSDSAYAWTTKFGAWTTKLSAYM